MLSHKTYVAKARREGSGWIVEVDIPELAQRGGRRVFTQAHRLDQVEQMARGLIALVLDVASDSFDVTVEPRLADDLAERLEAVRQLRAEVEPRQAVAAEATRRLIEELVKDGYRLREIAMLVGLSHQRVAQLARPNPVSNGNPIKEK